MQSGTQAASPAEQCYFRTLPGDRAHFLLRAMTRPTTASGRPLAEQVGSPLSPRAFPVLGKPSLSCCGQAHEPGMQALVGCS